MSDRADNAGADYRAAAYGPPPPVDATREQKGLYSFARYTVQNDHYAGFFQAWTKTILFLLGRQWNLRWSSTSRQWSTDTDIPNWRQQPVTNVTYAVYRTLAAKLTKQRPTLEVVPPSGDSDDREAAGLAESILVHLWRQLGTPAKVRRAIGWYLCTGQVYLRVYWDPEAGKLVPLTELQEMPHSDPMLAAQGQTIDVETPLDASGAPILGPDGQPDLDAEPAMVPQGDIALAIEDPMSVRYDPEATDIDDAREMYVAKLMTRDRAKARFNLPDDALEAAGSSDDRAAFSDILSSAAAGSGWMGQANHLGTASGEAADRVLVVEYYAKPTSQRPKGAHWISVGQRVVWPPMRSQEAPLDQQDDQGDDAESLDRDDADQALPGGEDVSEAPLPGGFWPPLIPVLALPIPGQPQAMGVLGQVVGLNEALNTLDGKILEHEVTMAMGGKWVVHPDDKGLRITSDPAQILVSPGYASGKPPIQAQLLPLPGEIYAERAVIMDKIRTVSAISEIEIGKPPEGSPSGRSFLVQQEVSDSVLGPDLESWANALEELGRRQLVLAQKHYSDERSIAIRGERGKWEVRSFTGADLTDGLDVRVQVGSLFPWSKSAQWDTKISLLVAFKELVMRPDGTIDEAKLAHYLDPAGSGLQSFESDDDPDIAEVERELAVYEAFNPDRDDPAAYPWPEIAFFQDHAKHYAEYCRFLKRDRSRYERWADIAKQAFMTRVQQTAMAIDQLAQTAVDAMQPGAPVGGAPADAVSQEQPGTPAGPPAVAGQTPDNQQTALSAADYQDADTEPAYA